MLLCLGVVLTVATLTSVCEAGIGCRLDGNPSKWDGGFKIRYTATADSRSTNPFRFQVTLKANNRNVPIKELQAYGVSGDGEQNKKTYTLTVNGRLNTGSSASNVIVVQCPGYCDNGKQYSLTLTEGSNKCTVNSAGSGGNGGNSGNSGNSGDVINNSRKNYAKALQTEVPFYFAQRSGRITGPKPANLSWVVSSGLEDKIPGGWYDAGDYMKFNLPMSWSATNLLWSLYKFKKGYSKAKQYEKAKTEVKWALDYLSNCWDGSNLIVQIGNGDVDHSSWGHPSNLPKPRPFYSVNAAKKGSDVAGMTAAALALGSIVFKNSHTGKANIYRRKAKEIYSFAKQHRGKYSDAIPQANPFYTSSGYRDELCVAAVWLYRATNENRYLQDAKSFREISSERSKAPWAYSWDDNKVACQVLLHEITKADTYKNDVVNFFQKWLQGPDGPQKTPCGLLRRDRWGPLRYTSNVAFLALVASSNGIKTVGSKNLNALAVEQINYILGDNGMKSNGECYSYMVGFGSNYPKRPHHRAASCSNRNRCDDTAVNPKILYGALVGGPDENDRYEDDKKDYAQSEVATDYNAGFQGALAGILSLSTMPRTANPCKCGS